MNAATSPPTRNPDGTWTSHGTNSWAIDAHTCHTLESVVATAAPADARFAASLLRASREPAPSAAILAQVQRLSLVAQMCNEIVCDPLLPEGFLPLLERMRFPLIKLALTDDSFFSDPRHLARNLVHDAAETAALGRALSSVMQHRTETLLNRIAEQLELGTVFEPRGLQSLEPIAPADIAAFLQQQHRETASRGAAVQWRVRRIVAQELEAQALGRALPAPALVFLRAGWAPLMAARLLSGGMNGTGWKTALDLLGQLLDSFQYSGDAIDPPEHLLGMVERELLGASLPKRRAEALMTQLRRAYVELEAARRPLELLSTVEPPVLPRISEVASEPKDSGDPANLATADQTELLKRLLLPESWFRVFDTRESQTLWLKVTNYYPQRDSLALSGFDSGRTHALRASRFAEDLVSGRSEPVNPTPGMLLALSQLRQRSGS